MDLRVVAIGHATLDAIVRVPRLPGPDERLPATDGALAGGGTAATAAVALARLGVPVGFAGWVGDDAAGRWIRDGLLAEGVDVRWLGRTGRSPFSVVLVDGEGRRALVPVRGEASQAAEVSVLGEGLVEAAWEAEWVHVDHVGASAIPQLRAAGVQTPISVDAGNPVPGLELGSVTLYAPTEAALLDRYPGRSTADALRAALDDGPRLAVATRGERGSIGAERTDTGETVVHEAHAFAVGGAGAALSTLGAGDVFHGALLAALIDDRPLAEALRWANAAAALACRGLDGRSAIPDRYQLEAALRAAER